MTDDGLMENALFDQLLWQQDDEPLDAPTDKHDETAKAQDMKGLQTEG